MVKICLTQDTRDEKGAKNHCNLPCRVLIRTFHRWILLSGSKGEVQSPPCLSDLSDEAGCFPQKNEPSGGALDFLCLWFFPARMSKLHAHLLLYAAFFLLRRDELAFGRGAAAIFWPGVCLFWQILALWPDGRRALFVIAFPSQFGRCAHSPTDTFFDGQHVLGILQDAGHFGQ